VSDFVASPPTLAVARSRVQRLQRTASAYVRLTKPRVVELLLVTTVPTMVLAARGVPALDLAAAVLIGGALAAGGANTINCWIERERDQIMQRTCRRPLPSGEVRPGRALVFGIALELIAFALLWVTAGPLAATLTLAATLFYVFVYTIWLKPRSTQNIVIGGAAGAVPVLVGWAAVTGHVASPAWVLFAVVFCWTPPHFWALALRYRDDYAAAGIPMLPVVKGCDVATRQIVGYSVIVVACTLALPLVTTMSAFYILTAFALGVGLCVQSMRLRHDPTPERAIRMFTFSNTYLALLFAAVAVDALLRSI
jgi:protoheme IX farnesyltransferase